jgi:rhodanese-related sulfurtransferase
MSKNLLGAILVAASLAAPAALACNDEKHAAGTESPHDAKKPTVKKVTITEVADLQKQKKVAVFDANGTDFRKQNGIIPGAVLLSHYQKYDAAKELPAAKDSKLVFYCANLQCPASHAAAEKALEAGYTDVSVLPDGLMGWKKAGQSTASVAPQS